MSLLKQVFKQGCEMQAGDQRRRVGPRLLKTEVLSLLGRRGRQTDRRIEDEMAEFVRDDVEIQRIWRMASVGKPMRADSMKP